MTTRLRNKLAIAKEPVRDAYLNGATLRQIADVHSVSPGTVRNLLKEMGVPMRLRGRRKNDSSAPSILPVEPAAEGEAPTDTYEGDFS